MDSRSATCGADHDHYRPAEDVQLPSNGGAVVFTLGSQVQPQAGGLSRATCLRSEEHTSPDSPQSHDQRTAFLTKKYIRPEDVWREGLNPDYWRWGLVFNQGNGMNVTEERVRERLRTIAGRLLRKMYGNQYRSRGNVRFVVFQHGSPERYDQHFHVLMAIDGEPHGWPDWRVALQVQSIDRMARSGAWNEKPVHVDFKWRLGNRYHSYTSRFLQRRNGADANWFVL